MSRVKSTATDTVVEARWFREHFGCSLKSDSLLNQALSHRSVGALNNERLEYLGDSVLGYVISNDLYERFPAADEGQLSRLRVSLVKGDTLSSLAREIDLGSHVRLGTGERSGGGRHRDSILADTFEAILGAIALDLGIEAARTAILKVFSQRLETLDLARAQKDPKTRLQELLQGQGRPLPDYQLLRTEGEDHRRTFFVCCELRDAGLTAEGEGGSRRAAEQQAADVLLKRLGVS